MKEMNTCQICERGKSTWKYTFHKKQVAITLEICDKCSDTLMLEDKTAYYRHFERIEEPKVLTIKKK